MTLWKNMMALPAAASPASTAPVRLCSARVVKAVTAAPHSTPSSRSRAVRTLSNGGGLGLDNSCSCGGRRLASGRLTPNFYVVRDRCTPA
jgi:hypothetical protein